jgi:hypothetical protein
MKSRKELINCNINDLTQEEIEKLGDMELNSCDVCGDIVIDVDINWIEGEDFQDNEKATRLVKQGNVSVCNTCFDKDD